MTIEGNYARIIPTVVSSMLAHTPASEWQLHLICRDVPDAAMAALRQHFRDRVQGLEVHIHQASRDWAFMQLGCGRGSGTLPGYSAMDRLLIPELFQHIPKLIYLDADVIVRGDLRMLFDTPVGPCGIAAAYKQHEARTFTRWRRRAAINDAPSLPVFFNAGVMVLEPPVMLREGFVQFYQDYAHKYTRSNDQIILNYFAYGRANPIPGTWNVMTAMLEYKKLCASGTFIHLLHYAGPIKPWNRPNSPGAEHWWARHVPLRPAVNTQPVPVIT